MRAPSLGLGLFFLIFFVPHSAAQGNESIYMIHMQDYRYLPASLEVPAGVEVVAMNFGPSDQSIPRDQWGEFYHTITASADRSLFDVQRIPPDTTAYPFRAPATPGTYPYYCVYHGDAQGNGMVGTLIVTAAASPSAQTPTPSPSATNEAPMPLWALILGVAAAGLLSRKR